jgi:hypothetical protein
MSKFYYINRDNARNYRFTTITDFGGIDTSNNAFDADLRTAHDALNVYVDEQNVLATRPRLNYKTRLPVADRVTSYKEVNDVYLSVTEVEYTEIVAYTTNTTMTVLLQKVVGNPVVVEKTNINNPLIKAMFVNGGALYLLYEDSTHKDLLSLVVEDSTLKIVSAKRLLPTIMSGANLDTDSLITLTAKNKLNNQYKVTYKNYLTELVADKKIFEKMKSYDSNLLLPSEKSYRFWEGTDLVGLHPNQFYLVDSAIIDGYDIKFNHLVIGDKDVYLKGDILGRNDNDEPLLISDYYISPNRRKLYITHENLDQKTLKIGVISLDTNAKEQIFDDLNVSQTHTISKFYELPTYSEVFVNDDGLYYWYKTTADSYLITYLSVVGDTIFEYSLANPITPYKYASIFIAYASQGYVCLAIQDLPNDALSFLSQYFYEINMLSSKSFDIETAPYIMKTDNLLYSGDLQYSFDLTKALDKDVVYDFSNFVEFGSIDIYATAVDVKMLWYDNIALAQVDNKKLSLIVDYKNSDYTTLDFPLPDNINSNSMVYTNGWIYYVTGQESDQTLRGIAVQKQFDMTILYEDGAYPEIPYNEVVFVGNEYLYYNTKSNEVHMSVFNNPTYLPETTYTKVGDDTPIVSCIGLSDNYYAVFKRNKTYSGKIGTLDEQGLLKYTSIVDLKTPIGCVATNGTIVTKFSNIPVTIAYDGIYGLYQQQNVLNLDHIFTPMSEAIIVKWWDFPNKTDFKIANVKYWTYFYNIVDSKTVMFVLDNRSKSWFHWELPIQVLSIIDEETPKIVAANGSIYEMTIHDIEYTDDDGEVLSVDYKDKVDASTLVTIDWFWDSQLIPLGTINYSKNLYTTKFLLVDNDRDNQNEYNFTFDYTVYRKTAGAYQSKTISNNFKDIVSKTMRSFIVNLDYLRLRLSNKAFDDTVEVDENGNDLHIDDCRLNLLGIELKYTLKESNLR